MAESFKDRKRVRVRVDVEAFYSFSAKWYPCVLRDLTAAGAGLKINQIFVPGDPIRVRFGPDDLDRVVDAVVANVNGNRIGVKFAVQRGIDDFLRDIMRTPV